MNGSNGGELRDGEVVAEREKLLRGDARGRTEQLRDAAALERLDVQRRCDAEDAAERALRWNARGAAIEAREGRGERVGTDVALGRHRDAVRRCTWSERGGVSVQ